MNTNGELVFQGGEAAGQGNPRGLAMLKLSPEDCHELRRQGFVAREVRAGRNYYKLRFRRQGRQVVIGLGKDPCFAESISRELAELQTNRKLAGEQRRLIVAAHRLLRRSKRELAPVFRDAGYGFHGYEIRRVRGEKQPRHPT